MEYLSEQTKYEIDELVRHRQWKRLLTATFVLNALLCADSYGNKIEQDIFKLTKFAYRPNPNEMYPVLHFLEEREYVKSHWLSPNKRSKRIYRITTKGQDAVPYMKLQVLAWAQNLRTLLDTIETEFKSDEDSAV